MSPRIFISSFFFFLAETWQAFVPIPGIVLGSLELGAQSLNHWTAREVPSVCISKRPQVVVVMGIAPRDPLLSRGPCFGESNLESDAAAFWLGGARGGGDGWFLGYDSITAFPDPEDEGQDSVMLALAGRWRQCPLDPGGSAKGRRLGAGGRCIREGLAYITRKMFPVLMRVLSGQWGYRSRQNFQPSWSRHSG